MQHKNNYKLIDLDNSALHSIFMIKKKHPKNWIKELRVEKNLTAAQLGEKIGMSGPYMTMLENSQRGLVWPTLQKLAAALECHPSDITDGPGTTVTAKNSQEKTVITIMRSMGTKDQERFIKMTEAYAEKNDKEEEQ